MLKPPRAHLDLLLGEEDLLGVVDDILRLPARDAAASSLPFSIIRISRTPRGPETPSTLPVWSPDNSLTMYSTAGAMPSGPSAAPGFSI